MPEGLRLTKNSDAAIIVLHEIYGINPFMHAVCQKYHSLGYDAYCPNLLGRSEYFPYDRQDIAYAHFIKHGGFDRNSLVTDLCESIRREYKQIFLLGFSVGATLAWISSASGIFDGAVCHYGSAYQRPPATYPVLSRFASLRRSGGVFFAGEHIALTFCHPKCARRDI